MQETVFYAMSGETRVRCAPYERHISEVEPTTAFCSKRRFGDKFSSSGSPKTAKRDEFATVSNPQPYRTRKAVDL
jgi:hypothetical protein